MVYFAGCGWGFCVVCDDAGECGWECGGLRGEGGSLGWFGKERYQDIAMVGKYGFLVMVWCELLSLDLAWTKACLRVE